MWPWRVWRGLRKGLQGKGCPLALAELPISCILIRRDESSSRGPEVGVLPSRRAFAPSAAFHLAYCSFCSICASATASRHQKKMQPTSSVIPFSKHLRTSMN